MPKSLVLDTGLEPIVGYKLIRLLGRGGFGEVWEAAAPGDFRVALKFIRLGTNESGVEEGSLNVIRNIRHPHLLDVQFATHVEDCLVIAMPLCDESLLDQLRANPAGLPRRKLIGYMDEVARAIDFLNEPRHQTSDKGLVGVQHRDIKPHNIFLVGGSVRLADFGLAKILAASSVRHSARAMSVHYVAPETFDGRITRQSDQYSLATTYFQLRTGRLPYTAESDVQIMYAHLHKDPDLSVLPELERAVVARALAKRPEDRWPTCRAFVRALVESGRSGGQPPGTGAATATKVTKLAPAPSPPKATLLVPEKLPRQIISTLGMILVPIPAGSFDMGAPDSDPDGESDQKPQHPVRITRPFYLGMTEVTVGQFRRFVDQTGYRTEAEVDGKGGYGWNEAKATFEQDPQYTWRNPGFDQTDEDPVVNVSWNDAVAFCDKLSVLEGLKPFDHLGARGPWDGEGYRLPTEAEWEYACRSGTRTRYESGDDPETLATVGNVADATAHAKYSDWTWTIAACDGYVYTAPVGRFRANAFGLYDMHGNVYEWCWDGYEADYYKKSLGVEPLNLSQAAGRVVRGGSWYSGPRYCRSASRFRFPPEYRIVNLGFRVARVQTGR